VNHITVIIRNYTVLIWLSSLFLSHSVSYDCAFCVLLRQTSWLHLIQVSHLSLFHTTSGISPILSLIAAVNCIPVLVTLYKFGHSSWCCDVFLYTQAVNSILHHAFPQRSDLLFGYSCQGEPVTASGELLSV